MRILSAVVIAVLVSAGSAIAAKPPKPPGTTATVTIRSSANEVTYGKTVIISGTTKNVPVGTTVQLEQNPYPYTGFKGTTKSAVVDPAGNYSIPGVQPTVHTQYRVVVKTSPPVTSSAVFVRVRLRVSFRVSDSTPKRGARVRFYGTVAPAKDGNPVLIQKKTATGYRTVSRTVLRDNGTATSKYSKRLRIRSTATYRVFVKSLSQAIDNGISRSRRLRVH